jgi:hypothetical protein
VKIVLFVTAVIALLIIFLTNFSDDFYLCTKKDEKPVVITRHDFKPHGCMAVGGNIEWPLRAECQTAILRVIGAGYDCKLFEMKI